MRGNDRSASREIKLCYSAAIDQRQVGEFKRGVVRKPNCQTLFELHFGVPVGGLQTKSLLDRQVKLGIFPVGARALILHFALDKAEPHNADMTVILGMCGSSANQAGKRKRRNRNHVEAKSFHRTLRTAHRPQNASPIGSYASITLQQGIYRPIQMQSIDSGWQPVISVDQNLTNNLQDSWRTAR